MTRRIVLLFASLLVVSFLQSGSTSAQTVQAPVQVPPFAGQNGRTTLITTAPLILSGADVGFRVTHMDGEIPVGEVVVRINGTWISPEIGK